LIALFQRLVRKVKMEPDLAFTFAGIL